MKTHESFLADIRETALSLAKLDEAETARLRAAKMVYGSGAGSGYRGLTLYSRWANGHGPEAPEALIEVCALAEESVTQLAGTTLHELAHVLAGRTAGHGPEWKAAARRLGLTTAEAAGQDYQPAAFESNLWHRIATIEQPTDGKPLTLVGVPGAAPVRPCSLGIGTRGGKSRGPGSGSRLRLWVCECPKPVKVRVASDTFRATCDACGKAFRRPE